MNYTKIVYTQILIFANRMKGRCMFRRFLNTPHIFRCHRCSVTLNFDKNNISQTFEYLMCDLTCNPKYFIPFNIFKVNYSCTRICHVTLLPSIIYPSFYLLLFLNFKLIQLDFPLSVYIKVVILITYINI